MPILFQDTSMVFTDPSVPTLKADAMMRTGGLHLFDFDDHSCNPNSVYPSNSTVGTVFANLISGNPSATASANIYQPGPSGLQFTNGNGILNLGGGNYDIYNKAFIKLLWFKQATGHPTTATQTMSHRSNGGTAIGSIQHYILMAAGGDQLTVSVASAAASATYNMGVTALDTVTQCGVAYSPATGIMQAIKNGVIVGSVALTGGGNLAQPTGTVIDQIGGGFGLIYNGFIYRQYMEDLTASGAAVADVAMLDYLSMTGRFV